MPFYYYYDPTYIILIPAIIFTMYAQMKVSSAYGRYQKVRNRRGITGAQAARIILDQNGLSDVPIEIVAGKLSDHYDPRTRVMRLSRDVYSSPSIAAVGIAAHESGHAIQHAKHYVPLSFRNTIAPVVSICSNLAWPLIIIGLLFGASSGSNLLFDIGVLFFAAVVLFHAVTLPVELNASKRALAQLTENGIVYNDEVGGARRVLSAAAMTYVAALATAILNLVRILAIRRDD